MQNRGKSRVKVTGSPMGSFLWPDLTPQLAEAQPFFSQLSLNTITWTVWRWQAVNLAEGRAIFPQWWMARQCICAGLSLLNEETRLCSSNTVSLECLLLCFPIPYWDSPLLAPTKSSNPQFARSMAVNQVGYSQQMVMRWGCVGS